MRIQRKREVSPSCLLPLLVSCCCLVRRHTGLQGFWVEAGLGVIGAPLPQRLRQIPAIGLRARRGGSPAEGPASALAPRRGARDLRACRARGQRVGSEGSQAWSRGATCRPESWFSRRRFTGGRLSRAMRAAASRRRKQRQDPERPGLRGWRTVAPFPRGRHAAQMPDAGRAGGSRGPMIATWRSNVIKLNTGAPRFRIHAHKMFSVKVENEVKGAPPEGALSSRLGGRRGHPGRKPSRPREGPRGTPACDHAGLPAAAPPRGRWEGRPVSAGSHPCLRGLRLRCPRVESDHSGGRVFRGALDLPLCAPDVRVGSGVCSVERKERPEDEVGLGAFAAWPAARFSRRVPLLKVRWSLAPLSLLYVFRPPPPRLWESSGE